MLAESKNLEIFSNQYVLLKLKLQKNYDLIFQMKSTVLTMSLTKIVMESLPQLITMTTIIINQIMTGYPRLQIIFENFFKTMIGLNGTSLCITVLLLTFGGYSSTTFELSWGNHYPMSAGALGVLTLISAHMIYFVAKIFLLSVVLSSAPYISTGIIAAEIGMIAMYLKLSGQSLHVTNLLTYGFSLSNFFHEELKNKKWANKRCFGLLTNLLIHLIHIVTIYLPVFLIFGFLGFFESFKSVHSDSMQLIVITIYIVVVFPFIALICLFEGYLNRWNILKKTTEETEKVPVPFVHKSPPGIDPIQPQYKESFTQKNKYVITKKRQELKEKRDDVQNMS